MINCKHCKLPIHRDEQHRWVHSNGTTDCYLQAAPSPIQYTGYWIGETLHIVRDDATNGARPLLIIPSERAGIYLTLEALGFVDCESQDRDRVVMYRESAFTLQEIEDE